MSSTTPTHDSAHRSTQVAGHAAHEVNPPTPRWVNRVARAAVITPPGFLAIVILLDLITPGYDPISRFASELSLGPFGWIMIANFIGLGVVVLALAVALGRTIGNRVSGWVATGGFALMGTAFVVAGVCVTDPTKLLHDAHTWHGMVHAFTAVVIFFISTPIAGLAMARQVRHRRGFALYCALAAVGTPALLIGTFVSGNLVGLAERIVIAYLLAWLTVVAHQLHRGVLAGH